LKVHTQAAGDPALFEDMLAEQADVREPHVGWWSRLMARSSSLGWRKVDRR